MRPAPVIPHAALFACRSCEGQLTNGYKASPFQVHHALSASMVICAACGRPRDVLNEGEAIPVSVARWPNLPRGKREAVSTHSERTA